VLHSLIKQLATAVVSIAAMLLLAAPASAVTRYASPGGTGDCSRVDPCGLEIAVEGAVDGDEVIVAPGDYGSLAAPLVSEISVAGSVHVHGPLGGPRPRIFSVSDSVFAVGPNATLRDVEIHHTGTIAALTLSGLAERVLVDSFASPCFLAADGAVLRNSVCRGTQDGPGVWMMAEDAVQLPQVTGTLRNVTAQSRFAEGIRVTAGNFAQLSLLAKNVIAQGAPRDVRAEIVGSLGTRSANVTLDHSNYSTTQQAGGGSVTVPGTNANQTAAPLFVDGPLGDFHQLAGSPTIDAGINDAANGGFDFEWDARAQAGGTDIGADELQVSPPPRAPVAPRSMPDRTRPVLSGLSVRPRRFAARRGATIRYRLSEAATVTFSVERARRGWRKGGRCLPRRKTGRRCTRYVRVRGSFTHAGHTGRNSRRFNGRMNGRRLKRGRYRLVAFARDAAGNRGGTVRAGMRVVRR
jgi:hypothetical protein